MKRQMTHQKRAGLTVTEMLLAVSLMVIIVSLAVPFFRAQAKSITESAGRADALQNARFTLNAIDREVRIAGLGVVDKQPLLVQADPYAITFNADLVTRDSADPVAVYYDPDAAPSTVTALLNSRKVTLPRSSRMYPDSTYYAGSIISRAETISYWASLDSTSGRSDEYVLFRRVNDAPPKVVTKGIIIAPGEPLFRYFRTDSLGRPLEIPQSSLPLIHTAAIHGAPNDTGPSVITDSIRIVRMRATGLYKDPQDGPILRTVESSIRVLNAGLINRTTCGEPPLGSALGATVILGPPRRVQLTWSASVDQAAGEKDVERYALFKRAGGTSGWGEPFASTPATQSTYTLFDSQVSSGQSWQYALIAQDCSPANSSLSQSAVITIP